MQLLEDLLTDDEASSIDKVLASETTRFDLLVKKSGLDPRIDFQYSDFRKLNFRGADLRGFNFTGSDLRNAVRNDKTQFDETTIFADAKTDWIEVKSLPIVAHMQKVELARDSKQRLNLLKELTNDFGKTEHVVAYMVAAASSTKSFDEFLDFSLFLPAKLTQGQLNNLRTTAIKLLNKRMKQAVRRTRRESASLFALDKVVLKLQAADDSLGKSIFSHLVNIAEEKNQSLNQGQIADINSSDMNRALSLMGTASS